MLKLIDKLIGYLLGLMVVLTSLLVLAQIGFRFFNVSLSWTTELASFFFCWTVFIGSALGFKEKIHFTMDFTLNKLSPQAKVVLAWINKLVVTFFVLVMVKFGFDLVQLVQYQVSPSLEISMSFFYATIPVSGLLMLWYIWFPGQEGQK